MTSKRSSIGNFLESTKLMLTNAREDELIRTLLLPFRVDEQRFAAGLTLCNKGYEMEIEQIKLHGQQYRAYKKFEKIFDEANEFYQVHLKFLRISFDQDVEKLKELSAKGIRPINIPDWLKQAFAFYQNSINDPEAIGELDFYGITPELLQVNEKKIFDVEAAYQEHKSKTGAAQDAIDKRDQVLKELADFRRRFVAVCRTALKDHLQLLEKLGIRVYSEGYVKAKPKTDGEQPPASIEQAQPGGAIRPALSEREPFPSATAIQTA